MGPLRLSANSYVTGDADPFRLRKATAFHGPLYVGGIGMVRGRERLFVWSMCLLDLKRKKTLINSMPVSDTFKAHSFSSPS